MTEVLHPDGSDCDYCTYDKECITVRDTSERDADDQYDQWVDMNIEERERDSDGLQEA